MKVIWYEITTPSRYKNKGLVTAGWQDSLEIITSSLEDVELYICFESHSVEDKRKVYGNVTYIPIYTRLSRIDRFKMLFDKFANIENVLKNFENIINEISPDIVHVFGVEWPLGLIANAVKIPVIVHIQGSIVPYYNALYPPKYNSYNIRKYLNVRNKFSFSLNEYRMKNWVDYEERVWKTIKYYMGRTEWDFRLSSVLNPERKYWSVNEALRPIFINSTKRWSLSKNEVVKLVSTGCSSFWKGPDMMLKTAKILKGFGLNFEWNIIGNISDSVKLAVQGIEGTNFSDNNIRILGFQTAEAVVDILSQSSLYVHTAYIENSPNSICEAQCIGIPIVSTNVGGISSLVENKVDGILVPANDPWQMAHAILSLLADDALMEQYSQKSRIKALARHNQESIGKSLMECYKDVIDDYSKN